MSGHPARTVLRGRVVAPDDVIDRGHVVLADTRIEGVGEGPGPASGGVVDLPPGSTVLPGLVDIHCHGGGGGGEFGADLESARRAAGFHHRSGSTTVVASVVSASAATLEEAVRVGATLTAADEVAGVHLEGPFLAPARAGAQDPACLVDVDLALVDRLLDASAGALRCMTFAPELPGAGELARRLVARGVVAAIGHTDATADQTDRVLETITSEGGRPLATHLFNAMAPIHHRHAGPDGNSRAEDAPDGRQASRRTCVTAQCDAGGRDVPAASSSNGPAPLTAARGAPTVTEVNSVQVVLHQEKRCRHRIRAQPSAGPG